MNHYHSETARRWLLTPITWAVGLGTYFVGQAIDAACELFDLDSDE